jgi:hypothetical protein
VAVLAVIQNQDARGTGAIGFHGADDAPSPKSPSIEKKSQSYIGWAARLRRPHIGCGAPQPCHNIFFRFAPDSPVKLPVNQPLKVSVSLLTTNGAEDDMDEGAWLRAASKSSSCDFLRKEPDLYHSTDGKPFHDAR